jgi:hypothetical protein
MPIARDFNLLRGVASEAALVLPGQQRSIMARRTDLKEWDKRLLDRIRNERWSVEDLQWVLAHLDARTPTLVIQETNAKLIEVRLTATES